MLTAKNLERIMELEEKLKKEYQGQIDAKAAEIEAGKAEVEKLKKTVETQLKTISELSEKSAANDRWEQQNRELTNRSGKLQEELSALKARSKTLQKELAKEREEVKELKKLDPPRMKKNLDSNKKKLVEANAANARLQQNLNKTRTEKLELERTVEELEARLAALEASDESVDTDTSAEAEPAAEPEQITEASTETDEVKAA